MSTRLEDVSSKHPHQASLIKNDDISHLVFELINEKRNLQVQQTEELKQIHSLLEVRMICRKIINISQNIDSLYKIQSPQYLLYTKLVQAKDSQGLIAETALLQEKFEIKSYFKGHESISQVLPFDFSLNSKYGKELEKNIIQIKDMIGSQFKQLQSAMKELYVYDSHLKIQDKQLFRKLKKEDAIQFQNKKDELGDYLEKLYLQRKEGNFISNTEIERPKSIDKKEMKDLKKKKHKKRSQISLKSSSSDRDEQIKERSDQNDQDFNIQDIFKFIHDHRKGQYLDQNKQQKQGKVETNGMTNTQAGDPNQINSDDNNSVKSEQGEQGSQKQKQIQQNPLSSNKELNQLNSTMNEEPMIKIDDDDDNHREQMDQFQKTNHNNIKRAEKKSAGEPEIKSQEDDNKSNHSIEIEANGSLEEQELQNKQILDINGENQDLIRDQNTETKNKSAEQHTGEAKLAQNQDQSNQDQSNQISYKKESQQIQDIMISDGDYDEDNEDYDDYEDFEDYDDLQNDDLDDDEDEFQDYPMSEDSTKKFQFDDFKKQSSSKQEKLEFLKKQVDGYTPRPKKFNLTKANFSNYKYKNFNLSYSEEEIEKDLLEERNKTTQFNLNLRNMKKQLNIDVEIQFQNKKYPLKEEGRRQKERKDHLLDTQSSLTDQSERKKQNTTENKTLFFKKVSHKFESNSGTDAENEENLFSLIKEQQQQEIEEQKREKSKEFQYQLIKILNGDISSKDYRLFRDDKYKDITDEKRLQMIKEYYLSNAGYLQISQQHSLPQLHLVYNWIGSLQRKLKFSNEDLGNLFQNHQSYKQEMINPPESNEFFEKIPIQQNSNQQTENKEASNPPIPPSQPIIKPE